MAGSNRFARSVAVTGIVLLVTTGPVLSAWVAGGPAAAAVVSPTPPAQVKDYKYYVVQESDHGRPEYLYEIAAKTLGNGNLAIEIFRLNKGRPQPGGGRLESPSVILPGWILILPASASGPGVRYGPLPAVTTPRAPVSSSSGHATPARRPGLSAGLVGLIATAAALLAALFTGGLMYLARRRKPVAPRSRTDDGQSSAAIVSPPEPTAVDEAFSWLVSQDEPAASPAPRSPADPLPDWLRMDDGPSVPGADSAPWPAIGRVPAAGVNGSPARTGLATRIPADTDSVQTPVQTPAGPPAPAYSTMRAEVHQVLLGGDQVQIALIADPKPAPDGPPPRRLVWAPLPYDTPDGGIAFACLGSGDRGCLFLDLGRAPGVITIAGDRQAAARLAESIAHQLCGASQKPGCMVVVIGDALPRPHPPGATWLASLDRVGSALTASNGQTTAIVFCELETEAEAGALMERGSGSRCRVIPVALNGPPEAPWSLTAMPAAVNPPQ
jgi:hypothetical protein